MMIAGRTITWNTKKRGITSPVGKSPPKIQNATLSPMTGKLSSSE